MVPRFIFLAVLRPQLHYNIILPPIWALPVYCCGLFMLLILMGCMTLILLINGRFIISEFLPVLFFAPLIDAFSMLTMSAGRCHLSVQPISGRFACPIALGYCACSVLCLIRNMAFTCSIKKILSYFLLALCVLKSCHAFAF